jgi:hypothetical protein
MTLSCSKVDNLHPLPSIIRDDCCLPIPDTLPGVDVSGDPAGNKGMLKRDHIRIADAVAAYYGVNTVPISQTTLESLRRGSVYPDIARGRQPHHRGRDEHVIMLIGKARHLFLEGDKESSAHSLGEAFHYIADGSCPGVTSREPSIERRHRDWESAVSRIRTPEFNLYELARIETPSEVLSMSVSKPCGSPYSSLSTSVYRCWQVLEVTWRPVDKMGESESQLVERARVSMPGVLSRFLADGILPLAGIALPIVLGATVSGWCLLSFLITAPLAYAIDEKFFLPVRKQRRWSSFVIDWYKPSKQPNSIDLPPVNGTSLSVRLET